MSRFGGILFGALILVGLAGQLWSVWFTPSDAPDAAPVAPPTDWLGTWVQSGGNGLVRFRSATAGEFSDGEAVVPFRARVDATTATFRVRLRGRLWTVRMTRAGDEARVMRYQEVEPRSGPVVIAPRSPEERAQEAVGRRAEAYRSLLPADFGVFQRVFP